MSEQKFTQEDWESCIKVLKALKDDPFDNPDNELFKTLVTKIHKKAKKGIRKEEAEQRRTEKAQVRLNTEISKQAFNNTTFYSANDVEYTEKYRRMPVPANCYCCNRPFQELHFFYNRLCPECAEYNYKMRFLEVDLKGRNIILTGSRVKIGYATALKVLRAGANLIATSRFPALALEHFKAEKDYNKWRDNLTVYGLDLRNLRAVEEFIHYTKSKFISLDIIINNAAQTIKYTDEYYLPLINNELLKLKEYNSEPKLFANTTPVSNDIKLLELKDNLIIYEKNRFGQPIDNRDKNSWNSKLDEISTFELLEANLINQISPYILIKELKSLFLNSAFKNRFIINVTSSEGQFSYTNKTIFHPHTNMTKAALNMMTRTSAEEFAEDGIYMNSVDVGWVSTGVKEELRKKQFEEGYIPPLDPVDGAARILSPIKQILEGNNMLYGKLLKNYKVTEW